MQGEAQELNGIKKELHDLSINIANLAESNHQLVTAACELIVKVIDGVSKIQVPVKIQKQSILHQVKP